MDEKLKRDTSELSEAGKKISEINMEISRAEQRILDLSKVATKKGQFATVVKQAQQDITSLKETIAKLESELADIQKNI